MATRNEAKRKSLLQVLALLVVAAVIVAVVVLAQTWFSNQPDPEPEDTALTATAGDDEVEVLPYLVAEPGVEPVEGDIPTIEVGPDETLTIELPRHVYDHDWTAVLIYDDPAANDERLHGPNDTDVLEAPGSVDPIEEGDDRPLLAVVEIQSVMIGLNEDGEETPYSTVWSVSTQNAEALADTAAE